MFEDQSAVLDFATLSLGTLKLPIHHFLDARRKIGKLLQTLGLGRFHSAQAGGQGTF